MFLQTSKLRLNNSLLLNKGIVYNILSVVIMAFVPVLNKFALGYIDTTLAAILSTTFAAMFCYLYAQLKRQPIKSMILNKSLWLIGLTNSAGIICLYVSLDLLNPIMIGVLGRFYIVFTIILSVFFLKERLSRGKLILIVTAILGMFLFVIKGFDFSNSAGIFLALLYTLLFAFTNMLIKISIKNVEANSILFYNNVISLFFIIVYSLLTQEITSFDFNIRGFSLIFLSALLGNFLGLLLFYKGLKYINFSTANMLRSTSPIWIALFAFPFFPIELSWLNVVGGALLLGSVVSLTLQKGQK